MNQLMLFFVVLTLAACGDKDPDNQFVPDMGPDEEMGPPDTTPEMGPDESCNPTEALGDQPESLFERELTRTNSTTAVSCDVSGAGVEGAWVGSMTFDQAYRATISIDGLPRLDDEFDFPTAPVWELRESPCRTGTALSCGDERTRAFDVEPDKTYFLVVNGELDFGGIQVQIDLAELVCEPSVSSCSDGVVTNCNSSGTDFSTAACVAGCQGGATCAADICEDAYAIPLTPGTPVTLNARRAAYTNTWSSEGLDGCNPYEPGPGGPSDGVEFFVRFTGLVAGQTLRLNAEQSDGNVGFYILPTCAPASCEDAFIFDDDNLNRGDYAITSDGDLLVAVEAIGSDVERDFIVEASLNP